MIADSVRTESYRKAIMETVRHGDVVLDLGAGLGVLSFFACKAGARKVYAIEKEPRLAFLAHQMCLVNGCQDRVFLIKNLSTKVNLPEKVDVIITEILGTFALDEKILSFVIDAKERFLKPGGNIIPAGCELFLTAVESEDHYKDVAFWDAEMYGIDFEPARQEAAKTPYATIITRQEFLSPPVSLKRVDFYKVDEAIVDETVSFVINKPGILHGWGGWFEVQLSEDVKISTSPELPDTHWKNIFFPTVIPMRVSPGDIIKLRIWAEIREMAMVWKWQLV